MNETETESKFYVRDLTKIELNLQRLGAVLLRPRTFEKNMRLDLADQSLVKAGRVLRIREDDKVRITYKGKSANLDGVLSRREIEFVADDFDKAGQLFESLGYKKLLYYEKYRTTYRLKDELIMLDELPYGNFVEIEGQDVPGIQAAARKLNLNWSLPIIASYHELFLRVCKRKGLEIRDLLFEYFNGIVTLEEDLNVLPADD